MENNLKNLPPFYVGQKVVVNKDYYDVLKKGDIFIVQDIKKCVCGKYEINIGLITRYKNFRCGTTKVITESNYFYCREFSPLQKQNFPLMKFKEIKENEGVKINEFEKQILIEN